MILGCPGSKKLKAPEAKLIACPCCACAVEIWSDESQAVCPGCRNIVRDKGYGPSCIEWCSFGPACVGEKAFNAHMRDKAMSIKEKLLGELEEYFGPDKKRINHAKKVMGFAQELLLREKGDWHIVIPASILHDVGIKAAEAKYGSSAGHLQEKEGPDIARKILVKFALSKKDIDEICAIIAHHHSPGKIDSQNFKLLSDADWLVNLKDEINLQDKPAPQALIDKIFLTQAGKALAYKIYLKQHMS